jgi:regulator of protease activity HflC (stomatin/prohibitin superfamily)
MIRENVRRTAPGGLALALLIPHALLALASCVTALLSRSPLLALPAALWLLLAGLLFAGLFMVNPNQARVLQLFGDYRGSVRAPGLRWANPFFTKARISLRVVSFESGKLKVNDLDGNPIEIAAIVVWKVVDSAQAAFEVSDYVEYVRVQSEAAVRNLASRYPYDAHDEEKFSLRGNAAEVSEHLKKEIEERVGLAGVEILEARISHLAYAPEIAQAMLQRQQAAAIIAARTRIVDGAVGMVEMALQRLAHNNVVHLDEERKAAMVSNLLVVLCGERATQPVINTGTIYQ